MDDSIFQNIREKVAGRDPESPETLDRRTHEFPEWMRRCFMTGKQCIFCPQETVFEDHVDRKERDTAFVIMPFNPNLDTFFEWSLTRYLRASDVKPGKIRRADQFANTGYVMCEKICLRIQQAGLVVAELSTLNPNVFYELGLAVGLNKPLLVVCDAARAQFTEKHWQATGVEPTRVLKYPNVGHLSAEKNPLLNHVQRVPLKPRRASTKIAAVLVPDPPPVEATPGDHDILVTFEGAIEAAVGVAITLLEESGKTPGELADAFKALSNKEKEELKRCQTKFIESNGQLATFATIAEMLDSSLISIVDLGSENPLSYFWLGYCHGRNINVVPIHRHHGEPQPYRGPSATLQLPGASETVDHVLAFDIRALWYMKYNRRETKALASKLAAVFTPILVRDVTTQQRRIFWERLTRSGRVYIYNGAVHMAPLSREVVGDWDLRTASELISYLSSTDESVVPVLQSPIYAPETIASKLGFPVESPPDQKAIEFLKKYTRLVQEELSGKNCLILASGDVNPITEVVLGKLYKCESFQHPSLGNENAVVVSIKAGDTPPGFPRRFSRFLSKDTYGDKRGFRVTGTDHLLPYRSQDQPEESSLLAHLVVARNPFSPDDNVIVILNGVSGPATFGLAEVLTGGTGGGKAHESEELLKEINKKWRESVEPTDLSTKRTGVETIVEVKIVPPYEPKMKEGRADEKPDMRDIAQKFYDKRMVKSWNIYTPEAPINFGNPRPFPLS